MKHKKRLADQAIGYQKNAPTSFKTLTALVVFSALLIFNLAQAQNNVESQATGFTQVAEASEKDEEADIRTGIEQSVAQTEKARRSSILAKLRLCESTNDDFAEGDGGDSIGPYQWQKPTLEDKLGRTLSYDEYYSIVTDYETIHEITEKTYFDDGESWRWKICTRKINEGFYE